MTNNMGGAPVEGFWVLRLRYLSFFSARCPRLQTLATIGDRREQAT